MRASFGAVVAANFAILAAAIEALENDALAAAIRAYIVDLVCHSLPPKLSPDRCDYAHHLHFAQPALFPKLFRRDARLPAPERMLVLDADHSRFEQIGLHI